MRLAILGTGGVGGYYAGVLARAGHEVAVLARGDNLRAIQAHGVRITTPEEHWAAPVRASDDVEALAGAETAIVAVKSYSLDSIAPAARILAEAGAVVVPLLNGVDAVGRLSVAGVPAAALLGGLTYISAARTAPGEFERRSPFQRVVVGEPGGGESARARAVAAAFADAGVDAVASNDITVALWQKMIFLAALSAVCGLARRPVGDVRRAPGGERLLERAVREAVGVARARHVAVPDDEAERVLERIRGLPDAMMPSLLLDVEAGGPTEIGTLSGALARMAAEAGLDASLHEIAAAAIEAATTG